MAGAGLTERDPNVQTPSAVDKLKKVGELPEKMQQDKPTTASKVENAKPTISKKRKSDVGEEVNLDSIELPSDTVVDKSPNQVRALIRAYINSGVKIGDFCNQIDVSGHSYRTFMSQNGTKGQFSDTYMQAFEFFKKRELAGVKMPQKKKPKVDSKAAKEEKDKYDVSDIHLEGEEHEGVEIYDTCDDVRKKINAHLRTSSVSNAAFIREIGRTFAAETTYGVSTNSLKTFLSHKGHNTDSHSPIYYAAYVYFEKLRIKQKKPRSKRETRNGGDLGKEGWLQPRRF